MVRLLYFIIFLGLCLSGGPAVAVDKTAATPKKNRTITIVTHESVPFMSSAMPEGGAGVSSLRKILKKMGYDLNIVFVSSWERAKSEALTDPKIDGYFPYATIENKDFFVFSDRISRGDWIIAERKDNPIKWKKLEDLGKYVGGNVVGVELRAGTKDLYEQKKLTIEDAPDNISNLRKLGTKRIDYAFMNPAAFYYHMGTAPELRPFRDKLQINPKIITESTYGVAFRRTRFDSEFMKQFNKAAANIDKLQLEYLTQLIQNNK